MVGNHPAIEAGRRVAAEVEDCRASAARASTRSVMSASLRRRAPDSPGLPRQPGMRRTEADTTDEPGVVYGLRGGRGLGSVTPYMAATGNPRFTIVSNRSPIVNRDSVLRDSRATTRDRGGSARRHFHSVGQIA